MVSKKIRFMEEFGPPDEELKRGLKPGEKNMQMILILENHWNNMIYNFMHCIITNFITLL